MALHIVGKINWDEARLAADITQLKTLPFSESYGEYAVGYWKTCALANRTGNHLKAESEEYQGAAIITALGQRLPYLVELAQKHFKWEHLKSLRVFHCKTNSMILPHKDYLEFEKGFTRLHIPILIDSGCFNTENKKIFTMKKGEVWFLDGREVHSAGSFGSGDKYSLILDFDPSVPIAELFLNLSLYQPQLSTEAIIRTPLSENELQSLLGLHKVINDSNFLDIVAILAKVHFHKLVGTDAMYDWLMEICRLTENKSLMERAKKMRIQFLGVA